MDSLESLPNNKTLYNRDLSEDLRKLYEDNAVAEVYAIFAKHPVIKSTQELAAILKISLEQATDNLDCLKNVGLVVFTAKGYQLSSDPKTIDFGKDPDKETRLKNHVSRLLHITSKLPKADKYSDKFVNACSSMENIKQLNRDLIKCVDDFIKRNENIPKEKRDHLISLCFANTINDISLESNEVTYDI